MPAPLEFSPIAFGDKVLFDEIRQNCDLYAASVASETTFQSVFCWAAGEAAQKCVIKEGLIILYEYPSGLKAFYPPLVREKEDFLPALSRIRDYCIFNGFEVFVVRVTKEMADLAINEWGCVNCKTVEVRDDFEYLYNPDDLINLTGEHYNYKRNLLSDFNNRYAYEFQTYQPCMKKEILDLVKNCGKEPASESLKIEFSAIERALDYLTELNLYCDVITIEGKVAAFSIGFVNEANVGVCLFEKADVKYRGIYVAINSLVAKKRFAGCLYVNRQEDVGVEGLRQSKMSWHPVGFSEKYIITNKPEKLDLD